MKKLLPPLILAVIMAISGCGKKNGDTEPTPPPTAVPSAAPQATAPESTGSPETSVPEIDTGGTNIERVSPSEFEDKVVADGRTENAFIGQWYAVGTTSGNAAFSALTLDITKDGYTVNMAFDNYDGTSEHSGEYTLKDGVLTFDENFLDCSAYFYKGDMYTLVLDNGTSLVLCKHLEQESEMR